MKLSKTQKRYCPKCKKHTIQTVATAKKRERGTLKKGSLGRAKKRGLATGFGNLGRWGSKPAISKFKRTGAKQSKTADLRYTCKECKKTSVKGGRRSKKLEIKEKDKK